MFGHNPRNKSGSLFRNGRGDNTLKKIKVTPCVAGLTRRVRSWVLGDFDKVFDKIKLKKKRWLFEESRIKPKRFQISEKLNKNYNA